MKSLAKAIEETASATRGLKLMYADDHPLVKYNIQLLSWLRELKKLRKTMSFVRNHARGYTVLQRYKQLQNERDCGVATSKSRFRSPG